MQKHPPIQKWKDSKDAKLEMARKTIISLSASLQEQLCKGIGADCKGIATDFDNTLNKLSLDEITRQSISKDLKKESPNVHASGLDTLIGRAFRRRKNTLRCLGRKVTMQLLRELFPDWFPAPSKADTPTAGDKKRQAKMQRRAAGKKKKAEAKAAAAEAAADGGAGAESAGAADASGTAAGASGVVGALARAASAANGSEPGLPEAISCDASSAEAKRASEDKSCEAPNTKRPREEEASASSTKRPRQEEAEEGARKQDGGLAPPGEERQ